MRKGVIKLRVPRPLLYEAALGLVDVVKVGASVAPVEAGGQHSGRAGIRAAPFVAIEHAVVPKGVDPHEVAVASANTVGVEDGVVGEDGLRAQGRGEDGGEGDLHGAGCGSSKVSGSWDGVRSRGGWFETYWGWETLMDVVCDGRGVFDGA